MLTEAQTWGLGRFAELGFTLEHLDDHILALLHDEERLSIFSHTGATEESLQAECARHLVIKHGWDGAIWENTKN